jgi:hypothetical protein
MGQEAGWVLWSLGWFSIAAGTFTIIVGARLLYKAAAVTPGLLIGRDQLDPAKALEALSKLPQWAVAVIVGYLQLLAGFWMLGAKLFGIEMY